MSTSNLSKLDLFPISYVSMYEQQDCSNCGTEMDLYRMMWGDDGIPYCSLKCIYQSEAIKAEDALHLANLTKKDQ